MWILLQTYGVLVDIEASTRDMKVLLDVRPGIRVSGRYTGVLVDTCGSSSGRLVGVLVDILGPGRYTGFW